eukprot:1155871-Pleurochrysis_carterae.AAC.3
MMLLFLFLLLLLLFLLPLLPLLLLLCCRGCVERRRRLARRYGADRKREAARAAPLTLLGHHLATLADLDRRRAAEALPLPARRLRLARAPSRRPVVHAALRLPKLQRERLLALLGAALQNKDALSAKHALQQCNRHAVHANRSRQGVHGQLDLALREQKQHRKKRIEPPL